MLGIPKIVKAWKFIRRSWSKDALDNSGLTDLIDLDALAWLARILGWPHGDLKFVYPRYQRNEFQHAVRYRQFRKKLLEKGIFVADEMIVSQQDGRAIAEALWDIKRPIDFRLYQERAVGWDIIKKRIP